MRRGILGFRDRLRTGPPPARFMLLGWLAFATVCGWAAPSAAHPASPAMDNAMSSAGWLQQALIRLEAEAAGDIGMLDEAPDAILREWRSFDRSGSALGALANVGWVALAAVIALLAETAVARGLGWRRRRLMRSRPDGPTVGGLLLLLGCDILGLGAFAVVFVYSRHWLTEVGGVTVLLLIFAANVLMRWRAAALVVRVLLRPHDPAARLVELPETEARRLSRFLSAAILAVIVLVGFGRTGLMDEDSGAPHVVALIVSVVVCALYAWIVFRAQGAAEALIRGGSVGIVGALRGALARAWIPIALSLVAALFLFFVFGLSLDLLSYYHATSASLGVILLLLVLERLTDRGWRASNDAANMPVERLVGHSLRRILRAFVLLLAAILLAWVWADVVATSETASSRIVHATIAASATLFVAFIAWELIRVSIDRNLQTAPLGPRLPGAEEDEEGGPGSRLQTVLPMVRIMFGALIAVIAMLIVLSRLGIDTAPLIAGAGVFGLAISFGSQSLVRDIISGLFYMWDDAFRIGEYIDTGRLKGTVEGLGIRSVKVRHHNGPLHTIPYGQLGAVTNMSRDFATVKFNLRLERATDVELVRKTAKRIGIAMQQEPEIAAEVILPLKMQGIAEITDTALVVRFKFTARPVKPSWIQREYLKRMHRVFAEQGIAFATGALTLQTLPPPADEAGRGAAVLPLPAEGPAPTPLNRPAAAQTQPA